jgi:hypothetical protein
MAVASGPDRHDDTARPLPSTGQAPSFPPAHTPSADPTMSRHSQHSESVPDTRPLHGTSLEVVYR